MRKITQPKIILTWIAIIVAALVSSCSLDGAGLEAHRYESPSEYYLYLPKGYSEDVKWPVFVGVHGSGGSGKDCWSMWQRYADEEGFILLCPSLADDRGGWYQEDGEAMVAAILNQIYQEYSIQNRVFVAGFSAGAQFVQGFAFHIPSYVYAVSMLSATIYYPPSSAASHIPFLVTIGDHESPETIQAARNLAGNLNNNGNHVEFYVFEGVGHFASEEAVDLTIDFFRRTTDTLYFIMTEQILDSDCMTSLRCPEGILDLIEVIQIEYFQPETFTLGYVGVDAQSVYSFGEIRYFDSSNRGIQLTSEPIETPIIFQGQKYGS